MYKSILVPLDGSEASDDGLQQAIELARGNQTTLHLLHVIDSFPMMFELSSQTSFETMKQSLRSWSEGMLETARRKAAEQGVNAQVIVRELITGRVSDTIVDVARDAACDLIVMGTHGRRGVRRLTMGSDAEQVVRSSPVPVLLVRHEDAKSASFLSKLQTEAGAYAKSNIPIQ